jgi:hypothetical protein
LHLHLHEYHDLSWEIVSLCFQLEDAALASFEKAMKDDNVPLAFDACEDLQKLHQYTETWCVWLWDHGSLSMFRGVDSYSKTKSFGENKSTDLVVRRVLCR